GVTIEHVTRLDRAAAFFMGTVTEVAVDRAGAHRLFVLAHFTNTFQNLLDCGAGRMPDVVAAIERHAQLQVEVTRHRQWVNAFDVQQRAGHVGERPHGNCRRVLRVTATAAIIATVITTGTVSTTALVATAFVATTFVTATFAATTFVATALLLGTWLAHSLCSRTASRGLVASAFASRAIAIAAIAIAAVAIRAVCGCTIGRTFGCSVS
ncbi:MAG: hypothetical protein ACI85K_002542, partial [Hyphomicrobiaceae bacterium]